MGALGFRNRAWRENRACLVGHPTLIRITLKGITMFGADKSYWRYATLRLSNVQRRGSDNWRNIAIS
jgi:hypothetical protein